jgi:hypothetical protein
MMKRFVCHHCGCDALEPEPYDFAYTCLVCLRRHSGLLALRNNFNVTIVHPEFMKAGTIYAIRLQDWVAR